ncbi:MAG: hypothetical protein AAGG11_11325 [Pseudomonadota bacterium]
MGVIEQQRWLKAGGVTLMEGLLAWERIPWVLSTWVQGFDVECWAAAGWRGRLRLRRRGDVPAALTLDRQQGRATLELGTLARVEFSWQREFPHGSEAQPGEAQPGEVQTIETEPTSTPPGGRVASVLRWRIWADEPAVLRSVDCCVRRLLSVARQRDRLLGQRVDGAGFPMDRCRRCFGPLRVEDSGLRRYCTWAGHEAVEAAVGVRLDPGKDRGVPEGREGRGVRALL